jgi:hypothetical protein
VSPSSSSADAHPTRTVSELDKNAFNALSRDAKRFGRTGARMGSVPWWMRFVLWLIAVPLGFIVVFGAARAFNLFTTNQLSDLFLANNAGRFWPAARLLPFVALVAAAFVQAGVYVLARWRGRRAAAAAGVGVGEVGAARTRVDRS